MHDNNTIIPFLRGPVTLSHMMLSRFVREGDTAIDATCGNGGDTVLLSGLVGESGRVWGFDIQEKAIDSTRQKLFESGFANRVTLVHDGHEKMAELCPSGIAAIAFNLGYLPTGDHALVTSVETTMSALHQGQYLLKKGGIIVLTLYPGHAGGKLEKDAVEAFAGSLLPREWHVWRMHQLNVPTTAPLFILLQKVS